jgi:membrane protein YqaA with SNARE-associated domain
VTTALTLLALAAKGKAWAWLYRLGSAGFFPLGIADNSLFPTPASMDALLVVLVARNREFWWFYAVMAVLGALFGAFINYGIFLKRGEEALAKRIGQKRADKAKRVVERYGFFSLVFGALAPPPIPGGPFVAMAAVMEYPKIKFLAALAVGRSLRYGLIALIVRSYGRHIFSFLSKYYKPAMWTLITLAVVGGVAGLIYYLRWKKKKREQGGELPSHEPQHRAA